MTTIQSSYSYLHDQHLKELHLESIADDEIKKNLSKANLQTFSSRRRLTKTIQQLKYSYTFDKTNIITSCFKMYDAKNIAIYAYLYTCGNDCFTPDEHNNPEKHLFVCTGPTYDSQDGEYRNRIISWAQFNELFKKYETIFEKVEEIIIKKMNSGIAYQVDFYYPNEFERNPALEESINNKRLPIKLHILCWLVDVYDIYTGSAPNHINSSYVQLLCQEEDLQICDEILDHIGHKPYEAMKNRIEKYYDDIYFTTRHGLLELECGQKIAPITVSESINITDINYNVWREIFITETLSNLAVNFISPSFPFLNDWFFIHNANPNLFNNKPLHKKYEHAKTAELVVKELIQIDKSNYESAHNPIDENFLAVSKRIHDSIKYVDRNLKLTDLAVCITSEYVGRTIRDIPTLAACNTSSEEMRKTFTVKGLFHKYIFEFIYAFYTMNKTYEILHGDVHLNNITLYHLFNISDEIATVARINDPHIAYIVGQKVYTFPHHGIFATLIDFSRAIIGNHELISKKYNKTYADTFMSEQVPRMMYMIGRYAPAIMDRFKDNIQPALVTNFPLMFKILTAVDAFAACSNIAVMLSIDPIITEGKVQIDPEIIELLKRIANQAENLMIKHLEDFIAKKISSPTDIEWPNLQLIHDNFDGFLINIPHLIKNRSDIVDIFNSNNVIENNIESYDSWGNLLRAEKEYEIDKLELPQDLMNAIKFIRTNNDAKIKKIEDKYREVNEEISDDEWIES